MNRRHFLLSSAAIALGCRTREPARPQQNEHPAPATEETRGLGAEDAIVSKNAGRAPHLRVILQEADGSSLDHDRARLLNARDLESDTYP
ncbi:MAG TPA: hypothetical protein VL282_15105, partial [Tepidisphaeraceae bacterium]|nr:hypothetical protein [Tepidisphaeraceae bacterium]